MDNRKKSIAISGRKVITPPTPESTPSHTRLTSHAGTEAEASAELAAGMVISNSSFSISPLSHAPSVPKVAVGDKVRKNQLIADIAEKKLGVKMHASISGTVTQITEDYIEIRRSSK